MKKIFFIIFLILLVPLVFAEMPTISVTEPQNNIYNSRDVQISLTADIKSLFYYSEVDNSGKWYKLCPTYGLECNKKVRFKEGKNDLLFKAVDSTGLSSFTEEVIFEIDSIKPVILKTFSNGTITNGNNFFVTYNKDDRASGQVFMNDVTLFYGTSDVFFSESRSDCLTGINQKCAFENIDLSSFDGETIYYWFSVSTASNTVLSKKTRIKVDTTPPEIDSLSEGVNQIISDKVYQDSRNQISYRKVKFLLDINEDNFDRVTYVDSNNCGYSVVPSQVLCTKLNVGRCIATRNFCVGHHSLVISAVDKSGNIGTIDTSFDIEP